MKLLNFGSLNIDYVYQVDHFVQPGETLASSNYRCFAGGKGANQSLALAKAGGQVAHAGKLGQEGLWLKTLLSDAGVDCARILLDEKPSGHAIIQVDQQGENCILLYGGANQSLTHSEISRSLADFCPGDLLLLQNEINNMAEIMRQARARGLRIFFNPAPMSAAVLDYPLELVDHFIINEVEGEQLTGLQQPDEILDELQRRYPQATLILTLGEHGVFARNAEQSIQREALKVRCVDSTGAGDTFIGYYLAELMNGATLTQCLELAIRASAITVTRPGAADSIPSRAELSS